MALILTLGFDSPSFARFEAARQAHFPPARNFIPAHLTLFQQLPKAHLPAILPLLADAARQGPLPFTVSGLLDFGGGAAYGLEMPGFALFHRGLRDAMPFDLARQDRQDRRPHVTVQNKVKRDTARATLAALGAGFTPWQGVADRQLLWHYRGGPWERVATIPLDGGSTET